MDSDASPDARAPDASQPATRVDAAHVRAGEKPASAQAEKRKLAPVATVAATPDVTASQVRLQASQLATHLQRQQATLDHREAELNARVAAMENQIRSARLWLDERQAELAEREAQLAHREKRVAVGSGDDASPGGKPDSARRAAGDVALDERAAELDRREAELAAAAERFGVRFGSVGGGPGNTASLETFRTNLERAEKLLTEQQADWQKKHAELAQQRVTFTRQVETERAKLADERRQANAALDKHHAELKRQEAELATRLAALKTLRDDVVRVQEETLEMRLATEELWSQLSGDREAANLTQSLGQIRLRLADEFRLAKNELAEERAEIQQLAARVAEQYQKISSQRGELQAWVNARHRELEQAAARLSNRQRQLDEQRAALEAEKSTWQSERFRLEQEIRQLLRRGPSASAA